jgi:hypothetical protein
MFNTTITNKISSNKKETSKRVKNIILQKSCSKNNEKGSRINGVEIQ